MQHLILFLHTCSELDSQYNDKSKIISLHVECKKITNAFYKRTFKPLSATQVPSIYLFFITYISYDQYFTAYINKSDILEGHILQVALWYTPVRDEQPGEMAGVSGGRSEEGTCRCTHIQAIT